MSRNVDPEALRFDRFLNLCHYAMISNYDTITYQVDPKEYGRHVRELSLELVKGVPKPDEPPVWWEGDEEASQSGLLAARQLGVG